MALEKSEQFFPENFDEKLYQFYQKRLELGEEAYFEFVDHFEEDLYNLNRAELILKYQLPHSWSLENIEAFCQNALELTDLSKDQFENNLKVLEKEKNKPIEYPKRYEANFEKGKERAMEYYLAEDQSEKNEIRKILDDILLAIENRKNSLPAPESLSDFNFRGWQETDYLLLHKELEELFYNQEKLSEEEITNYKVQKEREETRKRAQDITSIEELRGLVSETVKPTITDGVLLNRKYLDGKTLEEELTGGSENLPRPYDIRKEVKDLNSSNQLISRDIQSALISALGDQKKYNKFLINLKNTIISLDSQSSAYEKNKGNESVINIVMHNVSEKKQSFLRESGVPSDLALRALVDALYRIAIKVRNPKLNPTSPSPKTPENGLQKSLNRIHDMLSKELYDGMFVDDPSELKFVNAIGTPLDFSASCDCFFTFGDYVIPIDITANPVKAGSVSKYDESYLFVDTMKDKENRQGLNPYNVSHIEAYGRTLSTLALDGIKRFVSDVMTKLDLIRKKAPIPGYKGLNKSENIGQLF